MRVAVTSGRLGSLLAAGLIAAGHEVLRLVEGVPQGPHERHWEPEAGRIDDPGLSDVDAVANLYESSVWTRWTDEVRDQIRGSQVTGTLTVVSHLEPDGRCQRFANLSATSFYGDRGDDVLDADSRAGTGWLADSTAAWEAAARHAPVSTVLWRTPAVFGVGGGAWERRRAGLLSGRLGHGQQWRSWVHVDDWVAAAVLLLEGTTEGPVALAAPQPVRDVDLVAALARAYGRRPGLPVPEALLRARFGRDLTEQVLMASQRVTPRILPHELGFTYRFGDLDAALADLARPRS
ncbi:MAG: DUF1731 domain-containing protein [Propionibacteriaceae bacterium]|nr:DUF1731 domain-containing protein [Propionibacteriaceae bacterium]